MARTRVAAVVLVALAVTFTAAQQSRKENLQSLVDAEKAFAAMSVKTNIRDSFLANFADDGVVFNPNPVNAREMYSKRPAPPNPPPITLNWEPIFADVSQVGDLGYTTGPFSVTDNAKKTVAGQGFFFSVWKKQPEGNWKAVLDFGIDTPPLPDHSEPVLQTPVYNSKEKQRSLADADWQKRKQEFMAAEKRFSEQSQSQGVANAYSEYLSPGARLNRNGRFPLKEPISIRSYLKGADAKMSWKPIGSDLSKSGDLAYVYGSYEQVGNAEKGYYARVWQRDAMGNWKIVIDTARGNEEKN
jgi:ketosteroid isomerase-like protein